MSTPRSYQSPLREAQTAMTRERILMAAKEYLEQHDIESLTLRRVAELSGVSPPTVYAHFATMDDLVAAFFQWMKPRLGLNQVPALEGFPELPQTLFPRYEEYGALLRNLMNKPSWDRQRMKDRGNRHGAWFEAVGAAIPGLTPEQQRRGALMVSAFWTPTMWRWLMDTGGLTPKEAERVAGWAIHALTEALKNDAAGLDFTPEDAPAATPPADAPAVKPEDRKP